MTNKKLLALFVLALSSPLAVFASQESEALLKAPICRALKPLRRAKLSVYSQTQFDEAGFNTGSASSCESDKTNIPVFDARNCKPGWMVDSQAVIQKTCTSSTPDHKLITIFYSAYIVYEPKTAAYPVGRKVFSTSTASAIVGPNGDWLETVPSLGVVETSSQDLSLHEVEFSSRLPAPSPGRSAGLNFSFID